MNKPGAIREWNDCPPEEKFDRLYRIVEALQRRSRLQETLIEKLLKHTHKGNEILIPLSRYDSGNEMSMSEAPMGGL